MRGGDSSRTAVGGLRVRSEDRLPWHVPHLKEHVVLDLFDEVGHLGSQHPAVVQNRVESCNQVVSDSVRLSQGLSADACQPLSCPDRTWDVRHQAHRRKLLVPQARQGKLNTLAPPQEVED